MERGKKKKSVSRIFFLLQSDWKYNLILIGIILQVEILVKLVNWELLYDLKNYYRWSPGGLSWQPNLKEKNNSDLITYFKK